MPSVASNREIAAEDNLATLKRAELQELAKSLGLKCGNKKTTEMIEIIRAAQAGSAPAGSAAQPATGPAVAADPTDKPAVDAWLEKHSLKDLKETFAREEIDSIEALSKLSLEALRLMGLTVGKATRVMAALEADKLVPAAAAAPANLDQLIQDALQAKLAALRLAPAPQDPAAIVAAHARKTMRPASAYRPPTTPVMQIRNTVTVDVGDRDDEADGESAYRLPQFKASGRPVTFKK